MLTCMGMGGAIGSLFLTWERAAVANPLPLGALFAQPVVMVTRNGFGVGVHWPITLGALLCGAALLLPTDTQNVSRAEPQATGTPAALSLRVVMGSAGAFTCVVIALTRFAPLPGPLVCLLAGTFLLWSAIMGANAAKL